VGVFAARGWLRLFGCVHVCARTILSGLLLVMCAHVCAVLSRVLLVVCAHVCAELSVLSAKLDASDMLAVALGHFDDFGADRNELAATLLHAVAAAFADRERHLIARASSVPRAFKHLTAKEQDGGILVERFAGVAPNHRHGLAKCSERLAR
jgi:hypothetical protein